MKPKQVHQEAMHYSFEAKQAFEKGEDLVAQEYYFKAAALETELARFYFDKPELEPTRSTIVRSAAFLNLKAGLIGEAQSIIYWGMLNVTDPAIKDQLQEALELSIVLKNMDVVGASGNLEYLQVLRMRSVHYSIENTLPKFGSAITFETIRDFADNYLKSLRAYSITAFKRLAGDIKGLPQDIEAASKQFERLVNPLVASVGFGSFKFSIANDFLGRNGENPDIVRLKATVLQQYHDNIFTNPLADKDIDLVKQQFTDEEINEIFRPVAKIKAADSPYKVAYYDRETYHKIYLGRIVNMQKRKLLPVKQASPDEIGYLESTIVHARGDQGGKKIRSLIQREQLKSLELDIRSIQLEPKDRAPVMLNEEIIISVLFNSDNGFTFKFEDLGVEHTDTDYNKGLTQFYSKLYRKIWAILNPSSAEGAIASELALARRLINDPSQLKNP
jgi:hypothetical protein